MQQNLHQLALPCPEKAIFQRVGSIWAQTVLGLAAAHWQILLFRQAVYGRLLVLPKQQIVGNLQAADWLFQVVATGKRGCSTLYQHLLLKGLPPLLVSKDLP